jgi:hypothetical protein
MGFTQHEQHARKLHSPNLALWFCRRFCRAASAAASCLASSSAAAAAAAAFLASSSCRQRSSTSVSTSHGDTCGRPTGRAMQFTGSRNGVTVLAGAFLRPCHGVLTHDWTTSQCTSPESHRAGCHVCCVWVACAVALVVHVEGGGTHSGACDCHTDFTELNHIQCCSHTPSE